jgi:hypothetical protein
LLLCANASRRQSQSDGSPKWKLRLPRQAQHIQ